MAGFAAMMRRRLSWLLVSGLLAMLLVWVVRHTEWTTETMPSPLSGEALTDPFHAAERLVRALGAESSSLSDLSRMPPSRDLLVITNWPWTLDNQRRSALRQWVEAGGRLVLDDSDGGLADLQHWTGLELMYPFAGEAEASSAGISALGLERVTPRCRDVSPIGKDSQSGSTRPRWSICGLAPIRRLLLRSGPEWEVGDAYGAQALRMIVGRGRVFYVDGTPFVGRSMLDHDNALLFAIGSGLRKGDHVHFLTTVNAEPLLSLLWQNAAASIALLGCALTLLVIRWGSRFGPVIPANTSARRSLRDQIRGTAQFLRRSGEGDILHAASRDALEAAALRSLAGYGPLPPGQRSHTLARFAHHDPERLTAALSATKFRRLSDLTEVLMVLETTRRRLLSKPVP